MSHANLHDSAPTQFQDIGDVRLAYRRFGKEGAPPLVCLPQFGKRIAQFGIDDGIGAGNQQQ